MRYNLFRLASRGHMVLESIPKMQISPLNYKKTGQTTRVPMLVPVPLHQRH